MLSTSSLPTKPSAGRFNVGAYGHGLGLLGAQPLGAQASVVVFSQSCVPRSPVRRGSPGRPSFVTDETRNVCAQFKTLRLFCVSYAIHVFIKIELQTCYVRMGFLFFSNRLWQYFLLIYLRHLHQHQTIIYTDFSHIEILRSLVLNQCKNLWYKVGRIAFTTVPTQVCEFLELTKNTWQEPNKGGT